LQTMTTSALGDLIRTQLAVEIETVARERRVGRQLVDVVNQLLNRPGNTIDFMRRGSLGLAGTVAEGAAIPKAEPAYTKVLTVKVQKLGKGSAITREAIADAREDVVAACKEELGISLADKEDYDIMQAILDPSDQISESFAGDGTTKVFTVSQTPVARVDEVTVDGVAVTVVSVDPRTGEVELETAPASTASVVIKYRKIQSNYVESATAGKLDLADLNAARGLVTARKWRPNILVIREEELSDLLGLDAFIDASKYGAREPLLNGEIGKIYGMKVIVSSLLPAGLTLAIDTRARAVKFVPKQNVRVNTEEDEEKDILEIYATQRYGVGLTNRDPIAVIVVGL